MSRMFRRRALAVVCALGIAAGAAACGGETAVVTVTTDRLPGETTTSVPTTSVPATTATTTASTTGPMDSAELHDLLPPADAVDGVTGGAVRDMPTAADMIGALYQAGDPTAEPAKAELAAAGYRRGVLRDDIGTDPSNSIALFRSYIFTVADDATAVEQSTDSVTDVRGSAALQTEDLAVPGIPDARGVTGTGEQNGTRLAVAFISFPVGANVYGLQAVARNASAIDVDRLIEIAGVIHAQGSRGG